MEGAEGLHRRQILHRRARASRTHLLPQPSLAGAEAVRVGGIPAERQIVDAHVVHAPSMPIAPRSRNRSTREATPTAVGECVATEVAGYGDLVATLWTIGYERLAPDALVAELKAAGVERVLDVRIRPQSRRPGMSKTKLRSAAGLAWDRLRESARAWDPAGDQVALSRWCGAAGGGGVSGARRAHGRR